MVVDTLTIRLFASELDMISDRFKPKTANAPDVYQACLEVESAAEHIRHSEIQAALAELRCARERVSGDFAAKIDRAINEVETILS